MRSTLKRMKKLALALALMAAPGIATAQGGIWTSAPGPEWMTAIGSSHAEIVTTRDWIVGIGNRAVAVRPLVRCESGNVTLQLTFDARDLPDAVWLASVITLDGSDIANEQFMAGAHHNELLGADAVRVVITDGEDRGFFLFATEGIANEASHIPEHCGL
jgi:hypothetical protein